MRFVLALAVVLGTLGGSSCTIGTVPQVLAEIGPADRPKAGKPFNDLRQKQMELDLQREKLAEETTAEKEKARIEWAKLDFQKSNAWPALLSSLVPLLVALFTLAYSIWSFRKQAQQQNELQSHAAQLQFEIKAAEIAFAGKTPEALANRARALKTIFRERLPANFLDSFEPKEYGGGKESPDEKKFFLELLVKYPDQKEEIAKLWGALFSDEWIEKVKPLVAISPQKK